MSNLFTLHRAPARTPEPVLRAKLAADLETAAGLIAAALRDAHRAGLPLPRGAGRFLAQAPHDLETWAAEIEAPALELAP